MLVVDTLTNICSGTFRKTLTIENVEKVRCVRNTMNNFRFEYVEIYLLWNALNEYFNIVEYCIKCCAVNIAKPNTWCSIQFKTFNSSPLS